MPHRLATRVRFVALFASAALSLLAAFPVAAQTTQTKAPTCFLRNECIKPGTATNCDDKHCYDAGHGCPPEQGACYANPPAVPLQISIGGTTRVIDAGDYIAVVYNYAVAIAGIIAGTMIVVGGFRYLTAGGDKGKVQKAKDRIRDALLGLFILFGAYLMLQTINPDILKLQMPKIPITKRQTFASCAYTENCAPCGVKYNVLQRKSDGKTAETTGACEFAKTDAEMNGAVAADYDVITQCVGRGCSARLTPGGQTQCNPDTFRCAQGTTAPFACGAAPATAQSGFSCQACVSDGQSCGVAGASNECCGGYCAEHAVGGNTCASGEPGDACQENNQCKSGICQTRLNNSCSTGAIGSQCASNAECKTGLRCETETDPDSCAPGKTYSYCDADSECATGFHCVDLVGYNNVCMPTSVPNSRDAFKAIVCNPSLNGTFVDDCCNANADCSGRGGFCNTNGNHFCTDGSLGAPCAGDNQCGSNRCVKGMCASGDPGTVCEKDSNCVSGICAKQAAIGFCSSGGPGARCYADKQCLGNYRCASDHRCVERT